MTLQSGFATSAWSVEALTALIQAVLDGDAPINIDGGAITNSTVNSSVVGGVTPAAGSFTTLSASGAVAFSPASANVVLSPTGSGVVTISPATAGNINKMNLGATTPGTGAFTTLGATGAVTLSNASVSMSALPTADPHVAGRLWANAGVLTVSAGP